MVTELTVAHESDVLTFVDRYFGSHFLFPISFFQMEAVLF